MNKIWKTLTVACLALLPALSFAKSFNQCISDTQYKHLIERQEDVKDCFVRFKNTLGSDNCFLQIRKLKVASQSEILSENLKAICFYDASIFQNIQTCARRAGEFKNADNHDEAIFQCYRDFQDKISQKDCLTLSKKLIYPSKQDYLRQHCASNYN